MPDPPALLERTVPRAQPVGGRRPRRAGHSGRTGANRANRGFRGKPGPRVRMGRGMEGGRVRTAPMALTVPKGFRESKESKANRAIPVQRERMGRMVQRERLDLKAPPEPKEPTERMVRTEPLVRREPKERRVMQAQPAQPERQGQMERPGPKASKEHKVLRDQMARME